ncbi:hypothetical protein [Paraburkholderia sp. 2C]
MKTNDRGVQQSMYREYGEADATDGASQGTTPPIASRQRNRRSPDPRDWNFSQNERAVPTTPVSPPGNRVAQKDDSVTWVRLQGVKIKTNYDWKEVLTITADALEKPITAFLECTANNVSLLIDGRPATKQEKEAIRRVTEKFDSVVGASGGGSSQGAGKILHRINDALNGKMPSRDEVIAGMQDGVSMVDVVIPGFKGKAPSRPDILPGSDKESPVAQPASEKNRKATTTLKELAKQGPLSLLPAANRQEDQQRVDAFSGPVTFYRKDHTIPNPDAASVIHATSYRERSGVLTLGKGKDLTSYDPEMKLFLNRNRNTDISPALAGANVISLGSGDDGVAAINISFADLASGSTTVVTGGPMRGSTMLFTADDTGFSAYHAQASKNTQAKSADAAATSIADAHKHFSAAGANPAKPQNGFDAVFDAAKSHPFSALIYSCDTPSEGQPHPKFGPTSDAGSRPDGKPWSMLNFNYLAPDRNSGEVGTAEAIIAKDPNGKVTVQVLAERGKLGNPRNNPRPSFTYRPIESAVGSYTVRDTV